MRQTARLAACLIPAWIGLGILLWASPIVSDFDVFWHLRSGRWMLENGRLLTHDVFSFLSSGQPDEAVFAWASQLVFALVHAGGGMIALLCLNYLIVAGAMGILARYVWRETGSMFLAGIAASTFLLIHGEKQQIRPALFGELFFCLVMFELLPESRRLGKRSALALAAVLVAWHQFHSSALVLVPISAIYAVCLALDPRAEGTPARRLSRLEPALVPLLALASVLAQPAGWGAWWRAWQIAPLARGLGISEWAPFHPLTDRGFTAWLTVLGAPALLGLFLRGPFTWKRAYPFLVAALVLILPLQARRHRFFLVFAAAVILVEIGRAWRSRAPARRLEIRLRLISSWLAPGAVALASALLFLAFPFWKTSSAVVGVEKASDFIAEAGLRGNLSTFPFCGSYFLFRNFPAVHTGLDGRIQTHRRYFEMFFRRGPEVFNGPSLVISPETDMLLERTVAGPMETYLDPKEWIVVFENSQASLALRRDDRNRQNLGRVLAYYRARHIAFDSNRGYRPDAVFQANPDWFRRFQEIPFIGRWPTEALLHEIENSEGIYARFRNVPAAEPPSSAGASGMLSWHLPDARERAKAPRSR